MNTRYQTNDSVIVSDNFWQRDMRGLVGTVIGVNPHQHYTTYLVKFDNRADRWLRASDLRKYKDPNAIKSSQLMKMLK